MVVAGPGAGKTFVITKRVKNLISNHEISPKNILVTTFTDKAADELKVKLVEMIGKEDAERIHISTIHSFCKTMLEKNFSSHEYGDEINVLDDESQTIFIRQKQEELGIAKLKYGELGLRKSKYLSEIKKLYNKMTDNRIRSNELVREKKYGHLKDKIIRGYDKYVDLLKKYRMMDFSILQTEFYKLIQNNPKVLERIQNQFRFILVDEYQDTNWMQDKIFRELSKKSNNLFVVGDKKQSIYSFRGASPINFKNFTSVYPKASKYDLDVNFRSTGTIVNFSNKIFKDEAKEVLKSNRRKGERFGLIKGENFDESARKSVELIKYLKDKKIIEKYGDVALLFRSLNHSTKFVKHLSNEKVPFFTFEDGKLLERQEVRIILWLMSYVTQNLDYVKENKSNKFKNWESWWNNDLLTSEFFNFDQSTKNILRGNQFDLSEIKDRDDFVKRGFTNRRDIEVLKKLNKIKHDFKQHKIIDNLLLTIFYKLIDCSGYFNSLMNNNDIKSEEILRNLGKFSQIIGKYAEFSEKENMIGFLWQIQNMDEEKDLHQKLIETENTVKLMTVHKSKGLEFPVVFLCCMNEDYFPLKKKEPMIEIPPKFLEDDQIKAQSTIFKDLRHNDPHIQEEKRVFYVGLTRAQDLLVFTTSERIIKKKCERSQFLKFVQEERQDEEFKLPAGKKYPVAEPVCNLSYSSINTFISCPLRYALIHDYEFFPPPSFEQKFGTLIHNVLQRIHEKMEDKVSISDSEMKEIVNKSWVDLPAGEEGNRKRRENVTKKAIAYYAKAKDEYAEIIETEAPFSRIKDNLVIRGRVDLIVKDKEGKVSLIDFKSKNIEEDNDSVRKQLQIYNYCLEDKHSIGSIDKLSAYSFTDNKKTDFPIDNKGTEGRLKDVSEKIKEGNFPKRKNTLCKACPFKFYCWGESQQDNPGIFKSN